jgi:hypothetical protein
MDRIRVDTNALLQLVAALARRRTADGVKRLCRRVFDVSEKAEAKTIKSFLLLFFKKEESICLKAPP